MAAAPPPRIKMENLTRDHIGNLHAWLVDHSSEAITYQNPAGQVQLRAVVDDAASPLDEVNPTGIRFGCLEADLGKIPIPGETILYGQTQYMIHSVHRDQYGWVRLGCSRKDW